MSAPELSRRQVLAFIALADAPLPTVVTFRDDNDNGIDLTFHGPGAGAGLKIWMKLVGSDADALNGVPKPTQDGTRLMSYSLTGGDIGGHHVSMWAFEPAPVAASDAPVDEGTRQQLEQLVDETAPTGQFPDAAPEDAQCSMATAHPEEPCTWVDGRCVTFLYDQEGVTDGG